jgi:hypothetical protein
MAKWAKSGFIAPNTNQFRALFIDLKTLNGHSIHAIVEFKGVGIVGMLFSRLALGISGAIITCWCDRFERYCAVIPCRWSKEVPQFVGRFLFGSLRPEGGLTLMPLFKTELGVVFLISKAKIAPLDQTA